jgi:hypothetical protein
VNEAELVIETQADDHFVHDAYSSCRQVLFHLTDNTSGKKTLVRRMFVYGFRLALLSRRCELGSEAPFSGLFRDLALMLV